MRSQIEKRRDLAHILALELQKRRSIQRQDKIQESSISKAKWTASRVTQHSKWLGKEHYKEENFQVDGCLLS
jgi:hypothetical protein